VEAIPAVIKTDSITKVDNTKRIAIN